MARPEGNLEAAVRKWCHSKQWQCRKLIDVGQEGFPDRTVIGDGWVAFLELKTPVGKLRPGQVRTQRKLKRRGQHVLTSHNLTEIKQWLEGIDDAYHERNPLPQSPLLQCLWRYLRKMRTNF